MFDMWYSTVQGLFDTYVFASNSEPNEQLLCANHYAPSGTSVREGAKVDATTLAFWNNCTDILKFYH